MKLEVGLDAVEVRGARRQILLGTGKARRRVGQGGDEIALSLRGENRVPAIVLVEGEAAVIRDLHRPVAVEVVAAEEFADGDPRPGGDVVGERVGREGSLLRLEDQVSVECRQGEELGVVADHLAVVAAAVEEHELRGAVILPGAEPAPGAHLLRHLVAEEPVHQRWLRADERLGISLRERLADDTPQRSVERVAAGGILGCGIEQIDHRVGLRSAERFGPEQQTPFVSRSDRRPGRGRGHHTAGAQSRYRHESDAEEAGDETRKEVDHH